MNFSIVFVDADELKILGMKNNRNQTEEVNLKQKGKKKRMNSNGED